MVLQLILYFGTDVQLENNVSVPETVYYCRELLPKMAIQLCGVHVVLTWLHSNQARTWQTGGETRAREQTRICTHVR